MTQLFLLLSSLIAHHILTRLDTSLSQLDLSLLAHELAIASPRLPSKPPSQSHPLPRLLMSSSHANHPPPLFSFARVTSFLTCILVALASGTNYVRVLAISRDARLLTLVRRSSRVSLTCLSRTGLGDKTDDAHASFVRTSCGAYWHSVSKKTY